MFEKLLKVTEKVKILEDNNWQYEIGDKIIAVNDLYAEEEVVRDLTVAEGDMGEVVNSYSEDGEELITVKFTTGMLGEELSFTEEDFYETFKKVGSEEADRATKDFELKSQEKSKERDKHDALYRTEVNKKYDDFVKFLYLKSKDVSDIEKTFEEIMSQAYQIDIAGSVDAYTFSGELRKHKNNPEEFQRVIRDWIVALETSK